jgi:hypothetical protein
MTRWLGDPDFDLSTHSDGHHELRAVLRDLCEKRHRALLAWLQHQQHEPTQR